MTVFMTGATGYIGSTVSDALSREGHEVTGLARSGSSADDLAARGHRVTRGNLREPDGWRNAAAAAGVAAGGDGRVEPWPLEEAREALGPFADALALSQRVSARRARDTLGWTPEGPSVIQELLAGSYAGSA